MQTENIPVVLRLLIQIKLFPDGFGYITNDELSEADTELTLLLISQHKVSFKGLVSPGNWVKKQMV